MDVEPGQQAKDGLSVSHRNQIQRAVSRRAASAGERFLDYVFVTTDKEVMRRRAQPDSTDITSSEMPRHRTL